MAYVALKPCCFAGTRFKIGDIVPDEVIHPGAAKNLVKMNVIAAHGTDATPAERAPAHIESKTKIVVRVEEGDMPLELTNDGLQAIFDVLGGNVSEAETIIEQMTDGDALILLHISDSRKTIKEAAETRAKALNEADGKKDLSDDQEGEESEGEE